jgi:cell division protein FtsL
MAKGVDKVRPKRRAKPGPRSLIALVLVGFVLMATGVIARRVLGVAAESNIRRLRQRRDALEADRIRLEGVIREASSRARLQPIAEQRLNMHIPSPDQQVLLARPTIPVSRPPARRDSL